MSPVAVALVLVLLYLAFKPASPSRPGLTAGQVAAGLSSGIAEVAAHGNDTEAVALLSGLHGFAAQPPPEPHTYAGIGSGNPIDATEHVGAFGTKISTGTVAMADPATLGYTPGNYDPVELKRAADWQLAHPGQPLPTAGTPEWARIVGAVDMAFLAKESYGALPAFIAAGTALQARPNDTGGSEAQVAVDWAGGVVTS